MMEQMKPSGIDWIGDIPSKWNIGKIKHFYCLQTGFTPDTTVSEYYDDNGSDWVNISDMDTATHYIIETKYKISDRYLAEKHPKIVPEGSLLYSFKLSVGKVAFSGKDIYTNEAIASFLDSKDVNLGFLYYSSSLIIENANINIYGAKILNQELISNAPIIFPSIEEQQAIANYLDRECAQIDSIVADLEKQIALLQQYKKSLITETVTKGLDKSVPMKDSGVEWIGKIPEHWDAKRMKYFLSVSSGDAITNEQLEDGEYPVYGGGKQMGYFNRTNVDKNKILIGRVGANCGCVTITDVPSWATDNALVVQTYCHFKYIYYLLISADLNRLNEANAQPLITGAKVGNCVVSFTKNYAEQEEIARYLDEHCEKIENIIVGKQEQLETIRQHKKSLIYEYVTGKKRVKEVQ